MTAILYYLATNSSRSAYNVRERITSRVGRATVYADIERSLFWIRVFKATRGKQ